MPAFEPEYGRPLARVFTTLTRLIEAALRVRCPDCGEPARVVCDEKLGGFPATFETTYRCDACLAFFRRCQTYDLD